MPVVVEDDARCGVSCVWQGSLRNTCSASSRQACRRWEVDGPSAHEVLEKSGEADLGKQELVEAAHHEEFGHFESFVSELFAEADHDGDSRLNKKENGEFLESLRLHVVREVFGREDGEEDAALQFAEGFANIGGSLRGGRHPRDSHGGRKDALLPRVG